ncbi:alpha/beta hydrolase family protein [Roseateles asaccharophilus]|uniref:Dienelactone hydrolase n=1 Tax=Roseateles asaccharophilus TaxID=582607 RepID=A0ABU2AGY9_9BURK|nr:alpha/beta hydrolase family protein [Roseateles asaccharophilus]MDR7335908.1 dienelactone hydrolase [Roseateles asaccharophilus]
MSLLRRHLLAPLALWPLPGRAEPLDATLAALQRRWRPRLAWRADTRWRADALATARSLMQRPGDDGGGFATDLLAEQDRGSHVAQSLTLRGALGDRVPALCLRPKGPGPHPAVLVMHDHGARFDIGKEKMVRPLAANPSADAWVQRYYGGAFVGDTLVDAGFAVLAIDALGWGERGRPGFARDDQQALANHLLQLGHSWAGLIASDDLRAHRWLSEQPGVDAKRVAVLGFSMGAFRAWQLAAVAPEVSACVAAHWMCTREGLLRAGEHTLQGQSAFSMAHPGLAAELDHPDVAALIAPRPLLLMGSPEDKLFPWDAQQAAWRQLGRAWQGGAGLSTRTTPGGHRFDTEQQQVAAAWLAKQ